MTDDTTTRGALVARLQRYLEADPDNWSLRADLFDAALAAGAFDVARDQVEQGVTRRPEDAGWRHRQALLLLAGKEYARAQAVLEALVASGCEEPAVCHNLAYALFAQGQHQAARDRLAPLLGRPEESAAVAWTLWLRVQHRLGALDDAFAAFRSRSAQIPLPAEAFGVASLIAVDAGRLDEARTWCERALEGRPDQLEALAARGTLALAAEDPQGALAWFERALGANARDGRTWSGVAMARMLAKDLAGADEAFGRAVTTMPDHIGTWLGWGWCRFLLDRSDAAREAFERALSLDRNFGESHGALAVALLRLGRSEEAKREMKIALRLEPNGISARFAQATLSGEAADPAQLVRLGQRLLLQQRAAISREPGPGPRG